MIKAANILSLKILYKEHLDVYFVIVWKKRINN